MALPLRRDRDSVFGTMFRARYGEDVDLSDLRPEQYTAERLSHARSVWSERVQTEMRSAQIMGRFVSEVMAAGDPLDVYAGAVDMLDDEIRHVASASALLRALGGTPLLPSPVEQRESEAFLARPAAERALSTAISMLAIAESLSHHYIEDLARRCTNPAVARVIHATSADEAEHHAFGWTYLERSLARFEPRDREVWAQITDRMLAPRRASARAELARIEPGRRALDAWPEPELAELGLFSRERQALLTDVALRTVVEPKLAALGLVHIRLAFETGRS
jgi:hypothetical protein